MAVADSQVLVPYSTARSSWFQPRTARRATALPGLIMSTGSSWSSSSASPSTTSSSLTSSSSAPLNVSAASTSGASLSHLGRCLQRVGYLLRDLEVDPSGYVHATVILTGWCTMITGQSLVLYSRLHIVMHNLTRLRCVLAMIITNAIWLSVPIIVLVYGSNTDDPGPFELPYSVFEKLQLTVFFTQECIISGLYIYETAKLLKLQRGVVASAPRRVMSHLIAINVFIVMLDISILAFEFSGHYDIQTAWKPLVYSIKLKAEFSVLNRLVEFSKHLRTGGSRQPSSSGTATDAALERYMSSSARVPTETEYTVHIGATPVGKLDRPLGFEVVKTTAVTVSLSGKQLPPPSQGEEEKESSGVHGSAFHVDDVDEAHSASSGSSEV